MTGMDSYSGHEEAGMIAAFSQSGKWFILTAINGRVSR